MSKTYNGLVKPILLFNKEGEVFTPKPGLQPSYGIWDSLENAKEGLIEEFEDISNVPEGYTFAIVNANHLPEEWWFTKEGDWSSIRRKGVSLIQLAIDEGQLWISYDGGREYIPIGRIADISDVANSFIIRMVNDPDSTDFGTIKYSVNNGVDWVTCGKLQLTIENKFLYMSFDGGVTKKLIGKTCDCAPSGVPTGEGGGGNIGNLDAGGIDPIDYQGDNDSQSATYSGQDACDLLIYLSTDDYDSFNTIMQSLFPNANVGESIIIKSTLYDRTGGMSNASDGTHTYLLDPSWTTQDVLDNNTQTEWYHYYKITKVEVDKWAGVAWVGRMPQDEVTVTYRKLTIGTVNPIDATVTVSYGGNTYPATAGSVFNIPDGTEVTINATRNGYESHTETFNIGADVTKNISLTEIQNFVTITIGASNPSNALIYDWNGNRVYSGDTIQVAPGTGVWFRATCSGYNDWNYGSSTNPVIINQNTTITPNLTKISAENGLIRWSIYELYYYEDGTSNVQRKADGITPNYAFSETLAGATLHTHVRVETDGEITQSTDNDEVINTSGPNMRDYKYMSGSGPLDSLVSAWVEVEGHPEYNNDYQVGPDPTPYVAQSYINSTRATSYVYVLSSDYTRSFKKLDLSHTHVTPVATKVTINGTVVPFANNSHTNDYTIDRHFLAGTTVHVKAECDGYDSKEWSFVMPNEDYALPDIALDGEPV